MNNYKRRDDSDRGGFKKPFTNNRFGGKPNFRPRNSQPGEMFSAICSQCGDQCEVPFRPTGGKPVLCNKCFGQKDKPSFGGRDRLPRREFGSFNSSGNMPADEIKNQLVSLNSKLEKIISLLEKTEATQPALAPAAPATEKIKQAATVTKKAKKSAKK